MLSTSFFTVVSPKMNLFFKKKKYYLHNDFSVILQYYTGIAWFPGD